MNQTIARVLSPMMAAVLTDAGWTPEGIGWTAPARSNTAVTRLYNPYTGEHLYTSSSNERSELVDSGWTDEDYGFYSANNRAVPVYRLSSPHNPGVAGHLYTPSETERDQAVAAGWSDDGLVWYALG